MIYLDGLGRYGDPIDPNGDLLALQQIQCLLKPEGFLFLGIPIGQDLVLHYLIYNPSH